MSEAHPQQNTMEKIPNRTFPTNNLDSAWLTAEPNYTRLQNSFKEYTFRDAFDLFNAGLRLGNLKGSQIAVIEYDLVTAAESLALGLVELALSVFFDVCSRVEVSHGKDGFRTEAMNTVIQKIQSSSRTATTNEKPGYFGGKSKKVDE